jgi:uncharacterized membrane protein
MNPSFKLRTQKNNKSSLFFEKVGVFSFNESFMLKSRTNNVNSVITTIIIVIVIIIPALHGG